MRLFASLLSADFGCLAEQVAQLEASGVIDGLHLDVMDGYFVPNLAMGPQVLRALRPRTRLPMEAHLMVHEPARVLGHFLEADRVIVHVEACSQLHRDLETIRRAGCAAGVALNPATPVESVEWVLDQVDTVLLMGVDPGFGGQPFIPSVLGKVRRLRRLVERRRYAVSISIDGGVKAENAGTILAAGADVLAVGSALYDPPGIVASCLRLARAAGRLGEQAPVGGR